MRELIEGIKEANRKINLLSEKKAELEEALAKEFHHDVDGSKTYHADGYKVTLTTGYNYSLDKGKYHELHDQLPDKLNPVTEKIIYEVSPTAIKNAEKFADAKIMGIISSFVSKKPKKLHVKVEEEK